MFTRRMLLCGVAALALFAVAVTAGKPQPPPPPPPPPDPAILFTRAGEIWVENVDGSNQTPVITYATHGLYTAGANTCSWSGDNTRIAFLARLVDGGVPYDIYICNIDGSNVRKVLEGDTRDSFLFPVLLPAPLPGQPPGDEWIIFERTEFYTQSVLCAIRTDGTGRNRQPGRENAIRLTNKPARGISVSSDGTFIVYGLDSRLDVYRANLGIDGNGELFITGETSLTKVPGSPLEAAELVHVGHSSINPTDEWVPVGVAPTGPLGGPWLVPLDNPALARRPVVAALFIEAEQSGLALVNYGERWLDPECVVQALTKRGKEKGDYLYRSNLFTGEATMLFKFQDQSGHRTRWWRPSP